MKFGKAFARELPAGDAWRRHALAYKALKQLLKACAGLTRHHKLCSASFARHGPSHRTDAQLRASGAERAFFEALRDEIHKVNRFFLAEQRACAKRVELLAQRLVDVVVVPEGGAAWLRCAGREFARLEALESFCVLNFCAVSKLLKKHDKWTAFTTRARFERAVLVRQPFATYVPLLEMMRRVHALALGVSLAVLTGGWASSASATATAQPIEPKQLPPLTIAVAVDSEADDGTDSEDATPRSEQAGGFGFDGALGGVYSELDDLDAPPPRQRRRHE